MRSLGGNVNDLVSDETVLNGNVTGLKETQMKSSGSTARIDNS